MDRMTLRQILLAGLSGQVHFGKPFTRYERTGDLVTAFFADGSHETGDLLVGADGVNSRVARQLLPDAAVTDTGMRAIFGRTPLVIDGETRMPADMIGSGVTVLGPGRPERYDRHPDPQRGSGGTLGDGERHTPRRRHPLHAARRCPWCEHSVARRGHACPSPGFRDFGRYTPACRRLRL